MQFDITGTLENVVIGATGIQEIIQNVKTILATAKGSVPLDRDFGVDGVMVDEPVTVVRARRTADIIDAIQTYEPRVQVTGVQWSGADTDTVDGRLQPTIQIRIKEGVEL